MLHQFRQGPKLAERLGLDDAFDGVKEVQVVDRRACSAEEVTARLEPAGPRARRRGSWLRGPIRRLPIKVAGGRRVSLGYVPDVVYTRGVWMHRVDLGRAINRPAQLTADHDGRIVAHVVRDWAALHRDPFDVVLTGPAGSRFSRGEGGGGLVFDAVEFCRILSGRVPCDGVLAHRPVF